MFSLRIQATLSTGPATSASPGPARARGDVRRGLIAVFAGFGCKSCARLGELSSHMLGDVAAGLVSWSPRACGLSTCSPRAPAYESSGMRSAAIQATALASASMTLGRNRFVRGTATWRRSRSRPCGEALCGSELPRSASPAATLSWLAGCAGRLSGSERDPARMTIALSSRWPTRTRTGEMRVGWRSALIPRRSGLRRTGDRHRTRPRSERACQGFRPI